MSGNTMVPIPCFIRRKSGSGLAVEIDDGVKTAWVALSQIQARAAGYGSPGLAIVEMPEWLARQKGFV